VTIRPSPPKVPRTKEQARARASLAALVSHGSEPGLIEQAKARLRDANEVADTESAIEEIFRRAPAMTDEQAARIGRMFRYGRPEGGG
jgi:hypothetical protein